MELSNWILFFPDEKIYVNTLHLTGECAFKNRIYFIVYGKKNSLKFGFRGVTFL